MVEGRDLFADIRSSQGLYDVRLHLAEMIALLGAPPRALIYREIQWSEVKWSHAMPNSEGKLCQTTREYYGGPFFDSQGKLPPHSYKVNLLHLRTKQNTKSTISGEFMRKDLIPTDIRLEDSVLSLEGEDKRLFLDFTKKMLQWLPEDRMTAKELLEHPWLLVKGM
jgi:serine/threonine protein kinase